MASDDKLLDTNSSMSADWFDDIPPLPAAGMITSEPATSTSAADSGRRVSEVLARANSAVGPPLQARSVIPAAAVRPHPVRRQRFRSPALGWAGQWLSAHRRLLVGVAAAAVLAGGGVVAFTGLTGDEQPPAAPTRVAAPAAASAGAGPWCEGRGPGAAVAGAGDTRSVPALVAAFEHAYYDLRDAKAARALVAADARVGDEAALAAGIAEIPQGTRWCALVRDSGTAGTVAVDLYERRPSGELEIYKQLISVTAAPPPDGGVLISAIAKREDS